MGACLAIGIVPAHATSTPSADAPARPVPAPARELAEQVAGQLLQVQDSEAELDCARAVDNARSGLQTMLEVGEKNARDGYLPRAQYEATAVKLKAFLDAVTAQDCAAATGSRQGFYRCMSSDYNHVMACAKQYES
ncbi:hypothetical protein K4L06_15765 [Lysobacter sp. BMK333-48F3]|uniref:hypothetical protein n=1 Tax=Lysobacter sp. BMK333-48F3 TaxID=2867962 RepID=UPI001C8C3A2A|nr:hypothetical protein [Lysobacter sp. BMK333-48F3]MBX9402767.1 hypothetical protein [Lysobacter sp. BMK333-48F3]